MAERTDIRAYFLFAILYTTIVYPIAAHCMLNFFQIRKKKTKNKQKMHFLNFLNNNKKIKGTWSPIGWLYNLDYHDLAGSSVVHCTGGVAGLIGAIFLGIFDKIQFTNLWFIIDLFFFHV